MPIMHSALKALRADKRRTQRNLAAKTELKSSIKKVEGLIQAGQLDQAQKELKATSRLLDRLVSRGIIPQNRARRKKSRLTRRLNKTKSK